MNIKSRIMKRHITFLIILSIVILSCETKSKKSKSEFSKQEENTVHKDTVKKEISLLKIEFNKNKKSPIDDLGKFILHTPDTLKLKQIRKSRYGKESISYLYLRNYYDTISVKNSVKYYDWSSDICSFTQKFKGNINYSVSHCEEGMSIAEVIQLPKLKLKEIRKFIELLYYDSDNKWTSDYIYAPDGAGCSYEIKILKDRTIIEIFCGC